MSNEEQNHEDKSNEAPKREQMEDPGDALSTEEKDQMLREQFDKQYPELFITPEREKKRSEQRRKALEKRSDEGDVIDEDLIDRTKLYLEEHFKVGWIILSRLRAIIENPPVQKDFVEMLKAHLGHKVPGSTARHMFDFFGLKFAHDIPKGGDRPHGQTVVIDELPMGDSKPPQSSPDEPSGTVDSRVDALEHEMVRQSRQMDQQSQQMNQMQNILESIASRLPPAPPTVPSDNPNQQS